MYVNHALSRTHTEADIPVLHIPPNNLQYILYPTLAKCDHPYAMGFSIG